MTSLLPFVLPFVISRQLVKEQRDRDALELKARCEAEQKERDSRLRAVRQIHCSEWFADIPAHPTLESLEEGIYEFHDKLRKIPSCGDGRLQTCTQCWRRQPLGIDEMDNTPANGEFYCATCIESDQYREPGAPAKYSAENGMCILDRNLSAPAVSDIYINLYTYIDATSSRIFLALPPPPFLCRCRNVILKSSSGYFHA